MKSASTSQQKIPLQNSLIYYADLLKIYLSGRGRPNLDHLARDFESVDSYCRELLGKPFSEVKAVEIGFGPKPYRTFYFSARGVDLYAIDLDQPMLSGGLGEFLSIARRNGIARALKSGLRYWLFDRPVKALFLRQMREIRPGYRFPLDRLLIGNAARPEIWNHIPFRPQVIYSYLVIMHIPPDELATLVALMATKAAPDALLYITITIYPGLVGNQLPEWYPSKVDDPGKISEPWEHLRKDRYRADTYLNKMTRRENVELFSRHFDVLIDESIVPGLGSQYLTDDIRRELAAYSDYELLSNNVLLVMRPKTGAQPATPPSPQPPQR